MADFPHVMLGPQGEKTHEAGKYVKPLNPHDPVVMWWRDGAGRPTPAVPAALRSGAVGEGGVTGDRSLPGGKGKDA